MATHAATRTRRLAAVLQALENRVLLTTYALTDLGTLGGTVSAAQAINNAGQVVGYSNNSIGQQRAFIWTANGGMKSLGALADNFTSVANAINNAGQVVGSSENPLTGRSTQHAFEWSRSTGIVDLGTFSGEQGSSALGINDAGFAVGESAFRPAEFAGGQVFALTSDTQQGIAYAINNLTEAVGEVGNQPVAMADGQVVQLGGAIAGATGLGNALAINNNGQIVGLTDVSTSGAEVDHAFFYQFGMMTDIGTLGGTSRAEGINNSAVTVGTSTTATGLSRAFVWTKAGGMKDLNAMVVSGPSFVLTAAHGINDKGQIVGEGVAANGREHAFLLTPVPPDTTAPKARLNYVVPLRKALPTNLLTVTYTDNVAVNVKSISSNNITVTGPNGFSAHARFIRLDTNSNGTPRTAYYRIAGPAGGSFSSADNGTYSVILDSKQVRDTAGNFALGRTLGVFVVKIPLASATSAAVVPAGASSGVTTFAAEKAIDLGSPVEVF